MRGRFSLSFKSPVAWLSAFLRGPEIGFWVDLGLFIVGRGMALARRGFCNPTGSIDSYRPYIQPDKKPTEPEKALRLPTPLTP